MMGDAAGSAPTVRDVALAALEELDDVLSAPGAGGTDYSRGGHPFARLTDIELEVRLEPLVATAALRTPDTSASTRGPDWVRFSPGTLDRFAADRVIAWIEHAWRHAGK